MPELPTCSCVRGLPVSEKLAAIYCALLDINTNPFDPDAQAFFDAAGISNSTQKDGVNQLVLALKSEGIWSKMTAIYPFVGGTASTHSYNLADPSAYQITWNGGVTHNANGVTGNGSTGYGDLNATVAQIFAGNTDLHYSFYLRDQPLADSIARASLGAGNIVPFRFRNGSNVMAFHLFGSQIAFTLGFTAGSQVASGSMLMQANATQTPFVGADVTLGAGGAFIFQSGSTTLFSDIQHAFVSVGSGLSSLELTALQTTVQTFQTALGRNV